VLTLRETYRYLEEQTFSGIYIVADENAEDYHQPLESTGANFLTDKQYYGCIKDDFFYTAVSCYGDDSGRYSVFYGGEPTDRAQPSPMSPKVVPEGWYACFAYYGDMPDMLRIFLGDFYRWLLVKEIEPVPNGIGMLTIYDRQDMKNLQILIPVRQPK
jgi:AraC family transcriptional regulator